MSALVARMSTMWNDLGIEMQRFYLLWRYQHSVKPFTLWWRLVLKRVLDVSMGVFGLVLFAPVMLIVALAVKFDSPGPIFYSQTRVGRFGKPFKIYKFRSMRSDAEATGPVWCAGKQDPRATAVGAFLRRSHLDELPQFWNVIRGEMSLVGPRPERPCFVEQLDQEIPTYDQRHMIKPGMTGLAQVHYRYDTSVNDVRRKLRFDLLYMKRISLFLDVRILFMTMATVVSGRGKF